MWFSVSHSLFQLWDIVHWWGRKITLDQNYWAQEAEQCPLRGDAPSHPQWPPTLPGGHHHDGHTHPTFQVVSVWRDPDYTKTIYMLSVCYHQPYWTSLFVTINHTGPPCSLPSTILDLTVCYHQPHWTSLFLTMNHTGPHCSLPSTTLNLTVRYHQSHWSSQLGLCYLLPSTTLI